MGHLLKMWAHGLNPGFQTLLSDVYSDDPLVEWILWPSPVSGHHVPRWLAVLTLGARLSVTHVKLGIL